MKELVSVVLLVAGTFPVTAGISSGGGSLVVVAVHQPRTVAVAVAMPADFVSVPLQVISDQKNAALPTRNRTRPSK